MARYRWLVFTNCTPGSDADYNQWYDEVHVPDLLRIPGIVGVKRASVAGPQMAMLDNGDLELAGAERIPYRYLSVYELDTEDPKAVLAEVQRRARTPEMEITPLLVAAFTALYEDR